MAKDIYDQPFRVGGKVRFHPSSVAGPNYVKYYVMRPRGWATGVGICYTFSVSEDKNEIWFRYQSMINMDGGDKQLSSVRELYSYLNEMGFEEISFATWEAARIALEMVASSRLRDRVDQANNAIDDYLKQRD